jgi:hypothetical protein
MNKKENDIFFAGALFGAVIMLFIVIIAEQFGKMLAELFFIWR